MSVRGADQAFVRRPTIDVATLEQIVRCPICEHDRCLDLQRADVVCRACNASFPRARGVPVLLKEARDVRVVGDTHTSNELSDNAREMLWNSPGLSLNLGAGVSREAIPGCVEMEFAVFVNTTVVGDVHDIPFADNVFDTIVAMNAFEHFRAPDVAARHLLRILKPGGRLLVHAAFLQPLHEEPQHYYNATEHGIREWFRDFVIESVAVPENFEPGMALAWLASDLLWWVRYEIGMAAFDRLRTTTLEEWASIWQDPYASRGEAWERLAKLDASTKSRFAAGFEVLASKPV